MCVHSLTFLFTLLCFGGRTVPVKDEPVEAELVVQGLLGVLWRKHMQTNTD